MMAGVAGRSALRLVLLVAAVLGACTREDDGGAEKPVAGRLPEPPPIVVVTLDTVRADHLGCYGYHRDTSPHLDALAAEGVLFERALTPMATTLPSHVSLFSGLYPHQHGVTENRSRRRPFGDGSAALSVAQLLRDEGYVTAAFVSAAPVKRLSGVATGFDTFVQPRGYERRAKATVDLALEWLREHAERRFFLWVHLWDPHEPNKPAPAWLRRFPPDEGLERVIDERGIDPEALQERFAPPALRRFLAPGSGRRGDPAPTITRDSVRDMLSRYDADVAYTDAMLGRLLGTLRQLGLWERAIVVVTADHGQSLGQHDWLPHGSITNANLRVPLVMRFPPGVVEQPVRVARVVSLLDVMPTVLARFDSKASRRLAAQAEGEDALAGGPLRGWAVAQRTSKGRPGWAPGEVYALIDGRWKYVLRTEAPDSLYDLVADPGEREDVAQRHPEQAAELRAKLVEVLRRPGPANTAKEEDVPAAHLEQLRSLGYVE